MAKQVSSTLSWWKVNRTSKWIRMNRLVQVMAKLMHKIVVLEAHKVFGTKTDKGKFKA